MKTENSKWGLTQLLLKKKHHQNIPLRIWHFWSILEVHFLLILSDSHAEGQLKFSFDEAESSVCVQHIAIHNGKILIH